MPSIKKIFLESRREMGKFMSHIVTSPQCFLIVIISTSPVVEKAAGCGKWLTKYQAALSGNSSYYKLQKKEPKIIERALTIYSDFLINIAEVRSMKGFYLL
jgi:hypothetical protein